MSVLHVCVGRGGIGVYMYEHVCDCVAFKNMRVCDEYKWQGRKCLLMTSYLDCEGEPCDKDIIQTNICICVYMLTLILQIIIIADTNMSSK